MPQKTNHRSGELPKVEQIADRAVQYDRVERLDGRLYLVDTRGLYAPVEVRDEETKGLPEFEENIRRLASADSVNLARAAVAAYPWMTEEGKEIRDALLSARWRELFGDALFVIDQPDATDAAIPVMGRP